MFNKFSNKRSSDLLACINMPTMANFKLLEDER